MRDNNRDYAHPATRAGDEQETQARFEMFRSATESYNQVMASHTRGCYHVEIVCDTDISQFDSWVRTEMRRTVFDAMFSRFRAEGRYGDMTMIWHDNANWSRDTF